MKQLTTKLLLALLTAFTFQPTHGAALSRAVRCPVNQLLGLTTVSFGLIMAYLYYGGFDPEFKPRNEARAKKITAVLGVASVLSLIPWGIVGLRAMAHEKLDPTPDCCKRSAEWTAQ